MLLRSHTTPLALALVLLLLLPADGAGEEPPSARARGDVSWYSALRIRFKPGMEIEALDLAHKHFVPADAAIGRDIINFDLQTGDWHHVVFFPLQAGPSDLNWLVSPREAEWWAAFARLEGGVERAREIFEHFEALVEAYEWELAVRRRPAQEAAEGESSSSK